MQLLRARSNQILLYIVALLTLWAFAGPGSNILQMPLQFYLKDRLHESASRIALFGTLLGLPAYAGFLFGFTRDRWKPFGLGDRGYMLLFAPLITAAYLWYSMHSMSFLSITVVMVVLYSLSSFVGIAISGLTVELAQRHGMSGRLSSVVQLTGCIAGMVACVAGGWLAGKVSIERILQAGAVLSLMGFALAFLKPRAVFEGYAEKPETAVQPGQVRRELARLIRSRAFLSAALLWCMWGFGPGGGTPLFFYLTNTLKLTSQQYGWFNALTSIAYIPGGAIYALALRRFPFRKILFWSCVIGIPQFVFLLCIHTVASAMCVAVMIGMAGALETLAIYDLILRACPKGLEGTALMVIGSALALVVNLSNQLGSWLYDRGGFLLPVVITTAAYALIVPALRLVPEAVVKPREGEVMERETEILTEAAEPAASKAPAYAAVIVLVMCLLVPARSEAQTSIPTQTDRYSLLFATPDTQSSYAGPVQSMWGPATGGWKAHYEILNGWGATNASKSAYTDPSTPALVILGHTIIPSISLGDTGGAVSAFTKSDGCGLTFDAEVSGGSVSVKYPVYLSITHPTYGIAGQSMAVHIAYSADPGAYVNTTSPTAYADISGQMEAQFYLGGNVELFGSDLWNGTIVDLCKRTDPDSPFYNPAATKQDDKDINFTKEIINTNTVLSSLVHNVKKDFPPDGDTLLTMQLNLPSIETSGNPGSYTAYTLGTVSGFSYSVQTPLITIPDDVKNNPNASYARGFDALVSLTGDISNLIAYLLEDSGVEVPPFSFDFPTDLVDFNYSIMNLTATISLGAMQESIFVPAVTVTLDYPDPNTGAPLTTQPMTIDPVKGLDVTFTMPLNGKFDLTPHVHFGNAFTATTYIASTFGMNFDPMELTAGPTAKDEAGKTSQKFNAFTYDPLPSFGVSATVPVPVPVYSNTFEIPFDDQTPPALHLTGAPSSAGQVIGLNPSSIQLYNNQDWGAANPITLVGDTTYSPLESLAKTDTIVYSTQAYLDQLGVTSSQLTDITPSGWFSNGEAYNLLEQPRKSVQAGEHHILADSAAVSSGVSLEHVSTLPFAVGYATPHINSMGAVLYQNLVSLQDSGSTGYVPTGYGKFKLYILDDTNDGAGHAASGPATQVYINGRRMQQVTLPVNGPGNITVIVPADISMAPGNYTVQLVNPTIGGFGGASNAMTIRVLNPVPAVTQFRVQTAGNGMGKGIPVRQPIGPVLLTAGGPDTLITLIGSNFMPGTTVSWFAETGGNPDYVSVNLATSYVNQNTLVCKVPASLYSGSNYGPSVQLSVGNPAPAAPDNSGPNIYPLLVNPPTAAVSRLDDGNASDPEQKYFALGSPDTTLTIRGTNFIPTIDFSAGTALVWDNQLIFQPDGGGGQGPTIPFVDPTYAQITLPASLFNHLGIHKIRLRSGESSTVPYTISQPYVVAVVYPQPGIAATAADSNPIDPPTLTHSKHAATILVNGAGFYKTSKVTVNGVACKAAYVNASQLSVSLPATLVAVPGTYNVVVINPTSTSYGVTLPSGATTDGGPSQPAVLTIK